MGLVGDVTDRAAGADHGLMLNELLVAVSAPAVALIVKPSPPVTSVLMLRSPKDATPPEAATDSVPFSVLTRFGSLPSDMVTVPGKVCTVFPNPSSTVTTTAGVMVLSLRVVVGCVVNTSCVAAPALTTTVAVCVIATPPIVADTVFDSAVDDDSVPLATPEPSVLLPGCVTELLLPVAARTTARPEITLPFASLAVTVMVL